MRSLSANMLTALAQKVVRPVLFAELYFGGTPICLCTAQRNVIWDGKEWLGNGWFQGPEAIKEAPTKQSDDLSLTLSGVSSYMVSLVLNGGQKNQKGTIWLGLYDESWSLIADPFKLIEAYYDTAQFTEDADNSTLTITYNPDTDDLGDAAEMRMTSEAQRARYSDDRGFEFVESLADWRGFWGKAERVKRVKYVASKQPRKSQKGK